MNNLTKSLSRAVAVFAGGIAVWLLLVSMAGQSAAALSPALWVMLMGLYIIAFSVTAFWVHRRSVVGVAIEDSRSRRRPSFVIPVISTITLMIFIVAHSESNPVIWAMG